MASKTFSLSKEQLQLLKPTVQALTVTEATHGALKSQLQGILGVIAQQLGFTPNPNEMMNMVYEPEEGKLVVEVTPRIVKAANMEGLKHDRPAH